MKTSCSRRIFARRRALYPSSKIARHFNQPGDLARQAAGREPHDPTSYMARRRRSHEDSTKNTIRTSDTFAGINTEVLIEEGDIQSHLEPPSRSNTDLVIIGTRGRTGLAKVLGSSPKRFPHHALSVLTVGPHSMPQGRTFARFSATDFAAEAPAAAAYAVSLAQSSRRV